MPPPEIASLDWQLYQPHLDRAFHSREDSFPAGSPEHADLLPFISRLFKFRQQQKKRDGSKEDVVNPASEALGIPGYYEARFRVNSALVVDRRRVDKAIQEIERLHDSLPRAPAMTGAQVVEEYRSMLPWFEDWLQKRQLAKVKQLMADKQQLPMAAYEEHIVAEVRRSPAVVIAGDTGCGKSTQVPQFLVKAGFKRILCTQPRRISAISLCRRVSFETLNIHGNEVAYKIRFASTMEGGSKIVFMTEGILLRMMSTDPQLSKFDVVIIDEVHERHLNTDFLLALLRAVSLQRPDLRIVLMSATINFQAYSEYFGGAPVVKVPGRLYPIQLEYLPPKTEDERSKGKRGDAMDPPGGRNDRHRSDGHQDRDRGGRKEGLGKKGSKDKDSSQDNIDPQPYLKLMQRIDSEVPGRQRGDLLVFVSGMADIVALAEAMRQYAAETRRWIVLPLHSSLTAEDQDKVFDAAPEGVRKVIISTNIAETSITIDGVRFVADSGRAKEMLHDLTSGGGSLQEGWISRASADQRKGRAGRTGPGTCYRMYSEEQYNSFRAFSLPEIQRVRLESVVLQIKALAGSAMNPRHFGFIDPPPEDAMEAAMMTLRQVGALTKQEDLTPLGAVLSLLPVDAHIGKLLVLGCLFQIADPALTIAAALSVQSPFSRLADDDEDARAARAELMSPHGDAMTLLVVFEEWLRMKASGRGSSSRWCRRTGLEEQRLYEMVRLKAQFKELLIDVGLHSLATADTTMSGLASDKRHRPKHMRGSQLHAAKRRLRELQHAQDRERGKKVLKLEGEVDHTEGSEEESSSDDGVEDIHDLDMRIHVDVEAMFRASSAPLSRSDTNLLKYILAVALYPRCAVADANNKQRRPQDCRFHTAASPELSVHPSSSLSGYVSDMSSQEILVFTELLETRKQYICGLTPMWALPALLLSASTLDTDESCSRWVVDGWLLLRVHDDSGLKLMELICHVRTSVGRLLSQRLRSARLRSLQSLAAFRSSDCLTAWGSWQSKMVSPEEAAEQLHRSLPGELLSRLKEMAISDEEAERQLQQQQQQEQQQQDPGEQYGGIDPLDLLQVISTKQQLQQQQQLREALGEIPQQCVQGDEIAERLALMMEIPCRYSLERLKPGLTTTALYITPEVQPAQTSQAMTNPGEVELDGNGVPYRKYGVPLAPWLRWGCLKSYNSALAAHALNPAMRKHWTCPGCSSKIIGTHAEVQEHISACESAQALAPKELEGGYTSKLTDSKSADARKDKTASMDEFTVPAIPELGEGLPSSFGRKPVSRQGQEGRGGPESSRSNLVPGDGTYRLEQYMLKGVKWSRRTPALNTDPQPWRSSFQPAEAPDFGRSVAPADMALTTDMQLPGPPSHGRQGLQTAEGGASENEAGRGDMEERQGQGVSSSAGTGGLAEDGVGVVGGRVFRCPNCSLNQVMSPVQILQHKRACGRAAAGSNT